MVHERTIEVPPILLSSLSLRHELARKTMGLSELPDLARDHGFSGIEISDRQLGASDLDALKMKCRHLDCRVVFDISCDLTYQDDESFKQELDYVKNMLETAKTLGARVARVSLGGQTLSIQNLLRRSRGKTPTTMSGATVRAGGPAGIIKTILLNRWLLQFANRSRRHRKAYVFGLERKLRRSVFALHKILPRAKQLGLVLAIENHWGITSRPEWILRVINEIDSGYLGTCPDFGNFPGDVDLYDGLQALISKAHHVQAKSWDFDARGEETTINYARCMRILHTSGYRGAISVEYEGDKGIEGCLLAKTLIEKHWQNVDEVSVR